MSRISVELIPRSFESLEEEAILIKEKFPQVDTINIPDLLRFDIRSYDAAALASKHFPYSVPHIRAMDYDTEGNFEGAVMELLNVQATVQKNSLPALLIIRGDKPKDPSKKTFNTNSTELISFFKNNLPGIKIFAAIDPYRSDMDKELRYAREKVNAGAEGFFTQPFFDMDLMEKYYKALQKETPHAEIFWGVSPVTTEHSKQYWEKLNHVKFNGNFDLSFEGNISFAKEALNFVKEKKSNIYFMPIKVPLEEYLTGVFS